MTQRPLLRLLDPLRNVADCAGGPSLFALRLGRVWCASGCKILAKQLAKVGEKLLIGKAKSLAPGEAENAGRRYGAHGTRDGVRTS